MIPIRAPTFLFVVALNPIRGRYIFIAYTLLLFIIFCSPTILVVLVAKSLFSLLWPIGVIFVKQYLLFQVIQNISLQIKGIKKRSLCQRLNILRVYCPNRKCIVSILNDFRIFRNL